MRESTHVPVAYATANDYEYTVISMISVLENADSQTNFDFYILIDDDFDEKSKEGLQKYIEGYNNCFNITFLNVGNVFNDVQMRVDFINRPTYFRLLLPELLEEEYCIYLDSDTIVCTDLRELFETKLGENYIAGVKAPWYVLRAPQESYCQQALIPDLRQYINAGVLVMNLKQMRKDCVVEQFLNLLPLQMESQDQDIINSVCYNKIYHLPFQYNVMTKYAEWEIPEYEGVFSERELKNAWNNPKIIHYADRVKPWKDLQCPMGDYWWLVCKKSSMWKYFYFKMADSFFLEAIYHADTYKNKITTKKTFKLFECIAKDKIVIYGAGQRAVHFLAYLKEKGVKPIGILVSDKEKNPDMVAGIKVKGLNSMDAKLLIDKVVVVATLEKYHTEIFRQLQKYRLKEIIPLCDAWEWVKDE